MIGVWVILDWI